MKKIFFTVLLTIGFSTISAAQSKGDVEFGASIGINSSSISSSEAYSASDVGHGLNVGFAADYYFSDRWSIKGKLIYDQKGWDNDNIGFGKTNINLHYITVPVMASWHFGNERNLYLNFGPYIGFLATAEDSRSGTDLKELFNSTDFGLSFGIGIKVPVSDKLKIYFEYDGQSGLSNVFKDNSAGHIQGYRGAFNVGVNFILKQ